MLHCGLKLFAAVAAIGLASTGPGAAQPTGFLDDTFFGDGKVTLAPSGDDPKLESAVAAPDGRLVVAGSRWISTGQNTLFWQALGDASSGALCSPASPGGGLFAHPRALAFDASGRLLVAGTASFPSSGYDGMILRYLYPGCTLDSTFSGDGVAYLPLNLFEHFYDLSIDSQGRIVAAGDILDGSSDQSLFVARLLANGNPDTSFSGNGWVEVDWGPGAEFGDIVVQADDRIIAGGTIDGGALGTLFVVARIDSSGALDPTFAEDGEFAFDFPFGEDDRLTDLVLDPVNGRVLATGSSQDTDTGTTRSVVARLTTTGALDPTFDGDGRWEDNIFDLESIVAVLLQSDGRILIAGDAADTGDSRDLFAYRLHADGGIDGSYGFFGVAAAAFDLGATNDDVAYAATLQAGRLVIVGSADSASGTVGAAARFWSDLIFADGFERGSTASWPGY